MEPTFICTLKLAIRDLPIDVYFILFCSPTYTISKSVEL